jgi:hypothetical protein
MNSSAFASRPSASNVGGVASATSIADFSAAVKVVI